MSPAPVEKRYKEHDHCPTWSQPLDPVALNASLPRTAANFQRQLTPIQRALYFSIKGARDANRDLRQSQERGADVFKGPGYRAMARSHNVDPKTVYRNVKALGEKGWAFAFDCTGPKGERQGTWYVIPPWREVLSQQAANPRFAKATLDGKTRIVVIGRARRFMTVVEEGDGYVVAINPKNGERWRLRLDQVPETAELPENENAAEEAEQAATPAAPAQEAPTGIEIVVQALNEWCTTGAGEQDARRVIAKAEAHARVITRERATPSPLEVASMVRQIGGENIYRRKRSVGFMLSLIEAKVHTWNQARLLEIAQRTQAEARAATNPARSTEELEREVEAFRQDDAIRKRGSG